MSKKAINSYLAAAILCCSTLLVLSSCQVTEDKPVIMPTNDAAQLKQGIWTEYDTALEAIGDYTDGQLAGMPAIGMKIEGDKGYFFTYTAEDVSNFLEGQITYNKSANTGTITFPAITDSPISGQTVNFSMTSDELMEFEYTYNGQKATGTCAWLCDNLDNWGTSDEGDWDELMDAYQLIAADWGPDASIDWSGDEVVEVDGEAVTVSGLDEPLVWDETPKAKTRVAPLVIKGITTGLNAFSSLFAPDPLEEINAKLDSIIGKVDIVLQNQQQMKLKLDTINQRLIAIAQKLDQQEIVGIFNNRNEKYYNPLKTNDYYFKKAYEIYTANKNDLSKVSADLAEYAKEWAGSNEENVKLTWQYMEYITTSIQHTKYGVGMDKIYDGLTFDKYPWEHMGIADRKSYRAYDLDMLTKSLFMISLYSTYCGLSNAKKGMLYDNYLRYKPKLLAFSKFNIANPDEFLVCQIPGAHFVMHKELQKYNYYGPNGKTPDENLGSTVLYRPEWHEAGSVKIENPKELLSKLITIKEHNAMYDYYKSSVYAKRDRFWWHEMLVEGEGNDKAGGAVYAKKPAGKYSFLMAQNDDKDAFNGFKVWTGHKKESGLGYEEARPEFPWCLSEPVIGDFKLPLPRSLNLVPNDPLSPPQYHIMGYTYWENRGTWKDYFSDREYYAAIVEKRYSK